jgi:glycerol-3-phosphate dehydrogenase (NAD(P)+)
MNSNKVTLFGGGAWGSTLAQTLVDNNYEVDIIEQDENKVNLYNKGINPIFNSPLPHVKAYTKLTSTIDSAYILIAIPTKYIRSFLKSIVSYIKEPKIFINVSKGIEQDSFKTISQVVSEEIPKSLFKGFACLVGPSHAEELVKRHFTALVSASLDNEIATLVQNMFSNSYLRVYTSNDLIACELGGSVKNAIAIVSGIATGIGMGENARAALLTRGIVEMCRVITKMGGNIDTVFGLTGVGDLIVTATSLNSRNFRAGKKIGLGFTLQQVLDEERQTIEGFNSIEALHLYSIKNNIDLPLISAAYKVIFEGQDISQTLSDIFARKLKEEKI